MSGWLGWIRLDMLVYVANADAVASIEQNGALLTERHPLKKPGFTLGRITNQDTIYHPDGYVQVTLRYKLKPEQSWYDESVVWVLPDCLLPAVANAVLATELQRQNVPAAIIVGGLPGDVDDAVMPTADRPAAIIASINRALVRSDTSFSEFERILFEVLLERLPHRGR